MYLSDLAEYFSSRGVTCTINQLCILFASFCDGRNRVTLEEFQKYVCGLCVNVDSFSLSSVILTRLLYRHSPKHLGEPYTFVCYLVSLLCRNGFGD